MLRVAMPLLTPHGHIILRERGVVLRYAVYAALRAVIEQL